VLQRGEFFGGDTDQAIAQLREQVFRIIAEHDAALAHDFLRGTRKSSEGRASRRYDEEASREINLASQLASTDPQQALRIAQEHLEKGLPHALLNVLSTLRDKDSQAADKLAEAIMKKLRASNLASDFSTADFALALLRMAILPNQEAEDHPGQPPKPADRKPILDDSAIRELMNMVLAAALDQSKKEDGWERMELQPYLVGGLAGMLEQVEKYAPSRLPALKAKIAERNKGRPREENPRSEFRKAMESGSVDAMLEAASKAPAEMKESLYQQAMMQAHSQGDTERARKIANEHISDPESRDRVLADLTQQELWRSASAGKLEQTRGLMADLPPILQAAALIQAATAILGKGDKEVAGQVLDEARAYINGQPANFVEILILLEIARLYSTVDASKGFEIVEPAIDQFNALLAAASVLDGFEFVRHFKDGEMLSQPASLLGGMVASCFNDIGLLARADFDRAKEMADRFQRAEARIMARLSMLRGSLSDKPMEMNFAIPMMGGIFERGRMR
jgi:hypothetical protein